MNRARSRPRCPTWCGSLVRTDAAAIGASALQPFPTSRRRGGSAGFAVDPSIWIVENETGTKVNGVRRLHPVVGRSGKLAAIDGDDVVEPCAQALRLVGQSVAFGRGDRRLETFLDLAQVAALAARLVHFIIDLPAPPLELLVVRFVRHLASRPSIGRRTGERHHDSRYGGLSRRWGERVKISTPVSVTAIVCSNCAESERSRVTAVQPSESTFTCGRPRLIIGSMGKKMPGLSTGPSPARPTWTMLGSSWNRRPRPWPQKSRTTLMCCGSTYAWMAAPMSPVVPPATS